MVDLAKAVFDIGPSDTVKMVDVYDIPDTSVRNALTSKLSTFGDSVSDIFGKSTEVIKGIGDKLTSKTINLETAKNRVLGAMKGSRTDITSLGTELQNVVFSDITGLDSGTNYVREANNLINTVKVVTTQGTKLFTSTDQSQVSAIMRFVSNLTNNSIFKSLDLGAEAALVKGVIGEVSKWGVPSLVDDIIDGVSDKSVAHSAVSRAASTVAANADIDTVQAMINKVGAATLTAQTPDFAKTLLTRYRFKTGVTAEQYPALLTQLESVMEALQPNWFYLTRNYLRATDGVQISEQVANLTLLTLASDDVVTLLSTSDKYRPHVLSAPFYPSKSSRTLLKTLYPYIAIA